LDFVTNNIWDELVTTVNNYLVVNHHVNKYDSRRKPTEAKELQNLYGIIILIENTYGNNTHNFRAHFALLKQEFGDYWPVLGWDRFSALLRYYLLI
jgi:hypothetical protein